LAISLKLTELMGGEMWVESEQGKGSAFQFRIPFRKAAGLSSDRLGDEHPELREKRILIVDGTETGRRVLSRQVRAWGMVSHAVASGPEALDLLSAGENFDVCLLDMQLPEMDGMTVAHSIRRLPDAQDLPILLAAPLRSSTRKALEEPVLAATLTKPLKPSRLRTTLIRVLEGRRVPSRRKKKPIEPDPGMAERIPLRILLAEDNPVNQKVAFHLLGRLGYETDFAATGREVLKALERESYDVVLMDVQMPDLNGLETSRIIREKLPPDSQPWIVALTANAMKGDREACIAAGMNDYLSKPIRFLHLKRALERCGQEGKCRPETEEADPATVDLKALRRLFADGEEGEGAIDEMVRLFLEYAPDQIRDARRAFEAGDLVAVHRIAHSLKASSATVGAGVVSEACRRLEGCTRGGGGEDVSTLIAKLEESFERALAELEPR
jgi:CheY-like chemotaxis protein